MSGLLTDTLITGLPLVPVYLGVYLVLRIREDFDLTVEGSFALGGGVCAVLIAHGHGPWLALLAAVVSGVAAGVVTACLNLTLDIPVVLAGLVTSLALFSVTLRITGQPTVSLVGADTVATSLFGEAGRGDAQQIAVLAVVVALVLVAFAAFLMTELGLALRASGVNAEMVRAQGVSERGLVVLSLALSNGLTGLGAALAVQTMGYADVNMGVGTFVAGVGAVLLGVLVFRPTGSQVARIVLAVLVGTLLYRFLLVGALRIGVPAGDLKGITALTLVIAVAAQRFARIGLTALTRPTSSTSASVQTPEGTPT